MNSDETHTVTLDLDDGEIVKIGRALREYARHLEVVKSPKQASEARDLCDYIESRALQAGWRPRK